ncbi:protein ALP1-like [Amphibalanus amphitrite]|uniref:protein ALP1-like n=1 Tax=Amphibalanus amphitrite TaxID=1232801 RepID=UPI001C90E618|nr:protein ALP1-like [Amphibalanus amphitrite]XP_043203236.1 protein ALP1-like [Amphibalanus amphitrite]
MADEDMFLFLALASGSEVPQQKKKIWVRETLKHRDIRGEYATLLREARNHPEEFYRAYRMMPERFDELLDFVAPRLKKEDTNFRAAIPEAERLAMTLRYLASGMSQQDTARYFRMGKSTVSSIIPEVCNVLWEELVPTEMSAPTTQRWLDIAEEFEDRWNFPHCLGAIDGKHVRIQCPRLSGSAFFNYKATFSSVLMAVADADYAFTYVDVGAYGRENDANIFANSTFGQRLQQDTLNLPSADPGELEYVFIGDEAFQLRQRIMRPYPGSRLGGVAEEDYHQRLVYNYRLSRARRVVENAFGILVTRWRSLRQPIVAKIETVDAIVKATCVLHNFLRRRDGVSNDRRYISQGDVDADDGGRVMQGAWRRELAGGGLADIGRMGANNPARGAADLRERFARYFVSPEGSVPWQDAIVRRGRLQ